MYYLKRYFNTILTIKMKLFCFFVTFIFVHVSADDQEDQAEYKKQVIFTNAVIERACNMYDLTVEDNSGANGLERVILKMVNDEEDYRWFGKINLMIAVPEQTKIVIGIQEFKDLNEMRKSIEYQSLMRKEIRDTLDITIPEVYRDQNLEALDLEGLADRRRYCVIPALKNIIGRVLDGSLGVSLIALCRMLGLYMSTRSPKNYIISVLTFTISDTCITWDGETHKKYKKILGKWWQIKLHVVNEDNKIQLLEEQL